MKHVFYWLTSLSLVGLFPFNFKWLHFFLANTTIQWEDSLSILLGTTLGYAWIRLSSIPKAIYIFFHECAHAFVVLLCSGKIIEFKTTREFGFVKTNKTNLWIQLAPYILPLLPFLLLALYYATSIYSRYNETPLPPKWAFAFALALAHFTTTYYNTQLLFQETTDINRKQMTLSLLIIFNLYFFTSVLVWYGLLNAESLIDSFYFLRSN